MNQTSLFIEIGQSSLKALNGEEGLEIPLDRSENGRLTNECRQKLTVGLQGFLKRQPWQPSLRAFCGIGARGVSMRVLTLPASSKDEVKKLLHLQIESEFPLPPEQLAWGYYAASQAHGGNNQEVLVVVVKKETLQEYSDILSAVGVTPVFTLSAMARSYLCPQSPQSFSVLEIGSSQSELLSFENGAPVSLRVIHWGGEDITRLIQEKLAISRDQAEMLKVDYGKSSANGQSAVGGAIGSALESLAAGIDSKWVGQKLYLSGKGARCKGIASRLSKPLGGILCEQIELPPGEGRTAATLGLRKCTDKDTHLQPLILQMNQIKIVEARQKPTPWRWGVLAAVIVAGLLAVPCVEALVRKPILARKLAAIKADGNKLATIDREMAFLQHLKKGQPPYVDAVYAIANATQPGTRIDSISMSRRGDLSLRGSMRDGQQVNDFRSKLVSSGIFFKVSVDEQIPTQDRQKVNIRITAQWKPESARESLAATEELAKGADKGKSAPSTPVTQK